MGSKAVKNARANKAIPTDSINDRITGYLGVNIYLIAAFAAVTLISFYLRLKIHPLLTANPVYVLIGDSDSAGFLRLFDLIIHNFPKMPPAIDYYSNFPWGFLPDTPPIWPYFLALISLPMSKVLSMSPQQFAGLLVVGIATAAAIPIYWLSKEMFGRKAALVTAAIALVHPFFIIMGSAGIDHDTADLFLVPLIFALLFAAKRHFSNGDIRRFIVFATLGGIFIATSMMIALSLILVLSIIMVPIAVSLFLLSKDDLKPILAALGGQFGVATIVLLLLGPITPWFSGSLDFERLSYLHVLTFGIIAATGGANYFILRTDIKRSLYRIIAGITILVAIAAVISVPHLRELIISGYYRSIGSYPLGKNTTELVSVFQRGYDWLFLYYSYLIFIIPITFLYLIIKDIRQRKINFENLFFYAMLLILGFYTVQSLHYFSTFFSVFAVIVYGLSVSLVSDFLYAKLKNTKYGYFSNGILAAIGTTIVITIMVLTIKDMGSRPINTNVIGLAEYIKTHTDVPGDFYNPDKKPAYGIMSYWGDASRFQYISNRAMVSSANQEIGLKGIIVSDRFYQTTSENEALSILKELKVKYVIGGGPYTIWSGDISKIGEPGPKPDDMARVVKDNELSTSDLEQLMANRLLSVISYPPPTNTTPLHHFRLLFISYYDRSRPPLLLFEVVKGARLVIETTPGSDINVSIPAVFNGRRFVVWQDSGKTDSSGNYYAIIPYSTSIGNDPVMIQPCSIKVGNKDYNLSISERAVINGETVNLN